MNDLPCWRVPMHRNGVRVEVTVAAANAITAMARALAVFQPEAVRVIGDPRFVHPAGYHHDGEGLAHVRRRQRGKAA